MKNYNSLIGCKYYTYDEDTSKVQVVRIHKVKNTNKIIARVEIDQGEVCKLPKMIILTKRDIEDNYTKLVPDGIVVFNTVKYQGLDDVTVTVFKTDKNGYINNNMPYCICRQLIRDFFDFMIKGNWNLCTFGMSISTDTIPEGMNFNSAFAIDQVIDTRIVSIYFDDNFADIIKFINTINYDDALERTYNRITKDWHKADELGFVNNLRDLLYFNNFQDDLDRAFGVTHVHTVFTEENFTGNKLTYRQVETIGDEINKNIDADHILVKYDKTIVLSKIKYAYKLLRDDNGVLVVLIYNDDGETKLPSYVNTNLDIFKKFSY